MSLNESQKIALACKSHSKGEYNTIAACARAYGVPRTSLHHRLAGRPPVEHRQSKQQLLTRDEEMILVKWIQDLHKQYIPATIDQIHHMVEYILRKKGVDTPI